MIVPWPGPDGLMVSVVLAVLAEVAVMPAIICVVTGLVFTGNVPLL